MIKKIMFLTLLAGCGLDHRVSGDVTVKIEIDYDMLRNVCISELELNSSNMSNQDVIDLNGCIGQKYLQIMEILAR